MREDLIFIATELKNLYYFNNAKYGGLMMAKILVVEDEKPISDLITMNLKLVGH